MKTRLKLALTSICLGVVITLTSGVFGRSSTMTISTSPDYCLGLAVVGYKCPDVPAKAEGMSRGFPLPFRYEEVVIKKQSGFFKAKPLDGGAAQFSAKNFALDVLAWSLLAGLIATAWLKLRSKIRWP